MVNLGYLAFGLMWLACLTKASLRYADKRSTAE